MAYGVVRATLLGLLTEGEAEEAEIAGPIVIHEGTEGNEGGEGGEGGDDVYVPAARGPTAVPPAAGGGSA
jgi:hypothetical protein